MTKIGGDMLAAMKTRPLSEWHALFDALRNDKLQQVLSCTTTDELIRVQAGALEIETLRQFFVAEMQRK